MKTNMSVPKELYIDSFSFKPLRRDQNVIQIESHICKIFNKKTHQIDIVNDRNVPQINFYHHYPNSNDDDNIYGYFSNYYIKTKRFELTNLIIKPLKLGDKRKNGMVKPILENMFKIEINYIL